MSFLYLLSYDDSPGRGERALAVAEGEALTGGKCVGDHLLRSDRRADVRHAAFVTAGVEIVASAATSSELVTRVRSAGIRAERFWIESKKIPGSLDVPRVNTSRDLGAHIEGEADSRNPTDRFLLVATGEGFWFGKSFSIGESRWRRFRGKPYGYVRALPSRISRVTVNLVATPGDRVVDPCCGSGSILIEAADMGLRAEGFDIASRMVEIANANLAHFGFRGDVKQCDVREVHGEWDAVIADLPYGHIGNYADADSAELIPHLLRLAPRAAIVHSQDCSAHFEALGATVRNVIACPCSRRLVRHVHVVERRP